MRLKADHKGASLEFAKLEIESVLPLGQTDLILVALQGRPSW